MAGGLRPKFLEKQGLRAAILNAYTVVFAGSEGMEFERAFLEVVGPVAILRMNDPDVLNALSPAMIKGMTEALDALAAAETPARCWC